MTSGRHDDWVDEKFHKIFNEKVICFEIIMTYLETFMPQKWLTVLCEGSHGLPAPLFIPNKGKTLQQLNRQNSVVEILRKDVYLKRFYGWLESICVTHSALQMGHMACQHPIFSLVWAKSHLEGPQWSADPQPQSTRWNPMWHSFALCISKFYIYKIEKEAQNQVKQCLLWAWVSSFIYCKGWLFPYIGLSTANILSYCVYFIFVTDISKFSDMARGGVTENR